MISPIAPSLVGNGLAMRMGLFAQALSRVAQLTILVVPVAGPSRDAESFTRGIGAQMHVVNIQGREDTHFALLRRLGDSAARLEAFRVYGKPSLSASLSSPVLTEIARLANAARPEIIHIGRSYLLPCVDSLPNADTMALDLDEDDLSSNESIARLARQRGDLLEAEWQAQEGLACDALVTRYGARFQRLFVANPADAPRMSGRHPGLAFTPQLNAIHIPARMVKRDEGANILFVGALGYAPNADGLAWFCEAVLPRLRRRSPIAPRVVVAGAGAPARIASLARLPGVSVLGWTQDIAALYARATLAIAPMRSGGGTRIKLLEAAAHRTASVATAVAADGIGWGPNAGGWRASSASDFAKACLTAMDDKGARDQRAENGLKWVARHHARGRLVAALSREFGELVGAPATTRQFSGAET